MVKKMEGYQGSAESTMGSDLSEFADVRTFAELLGSILLCIAFLICVPNLIFACVHQG